MKILNWFALIMLLFVSCNKDDIPPNPTWGNMSVLMNNEKWADRYAGGQGTIYGGSYRWTEPCQAQYYDLVMYLYNSNRFLRESLSFNLADFEPGTKATGQYKILKNQWQCDSVATVYSGYGTIAEDGDVVQDVYDVLETEDNFLQIESFDANSREIKGTFQVTFIITRRSTEPSTLPDTLRFTNGKFHTKIIF